MIKSVPEVRIFKESDHPTMGRQERGQVKERSTASKAAPFCVAVGIICAAVVGLAAVLGTFEVALRVRYIPRGKITLKPFLHLGD